MGHTSRCRRTTGGPTPSGAPGPTWHLRPCPLAVLVRHASYAQCARSCGQTTARDSSPVCVASECRRTHHRVSFPGFSRLLERGGERVDWRADFEGREHAPEGRDYNVWQLFPAQTSTADGASGVSWSFSPIKEALALTSNTPPET